MKARAVAGLLMFLILVSCQKETRQTIEFVKKGVPAGIEIRGLQAGEGDYLLSDETFFLKAKKAIYGETIFVRMRLSINRFEGYLPITVGDNILSILSEPGEEGLFLQGPSIGKTVRVGGISDFIKPDVPFNLVISYKNKEITYTIDDNELFSQESDIPPVGFIMMGDFGTEVKIYDIVCEGHFKSVDSFYTREFLLDRAHKSVARAAERVKEDPNRPAFHFQPPANWNNDPNGTLFYQGYYHLFYQHNPYSDRWNWMHWGHARSKDLVRWEHLPIALWPSVDRGENHCFSGSGYIKDDGKPILFYTSIGHENPEHWAAVPADDALKEWKKHTANPIVVMDAHGDQFIEEWRDPFLFRESGDTYMVIGGHPRGSYGSIMMYRAMNPELTDWEYLGSPFTGKEENWECPNFFKIGDRYVLIYSPHGRVKYITGTMDFDKVRFTPESHGFVDNGSSWNYYAPNTLQKEDGRRILFGWIHGFKENQGWQGAISLPRDLSVDDRGRLVQKPVPEHTELRGERTRLTNVTLGNTSKKLVTGYPQFEMMIDIAEGGTDRLGFRFDDENGIPYEIVLTPRAFLFGEEEVAVDPVLDEKIQTVQFFFDRTVIEIFVNGGVLCATEVIYPDKDNLNFEIFTREGDIVLESIDLWKMNSIW
jgi:beta-fructofuranosidase